MKFQQNCDNKMENEILKSFDLKLEACSTLLNTIVFLVYIAHAKYISLLFFLHSIYRGEISKKSGLIYDEL